jgi:uncharacterized cupin superfamily protein
MPAITFQKSVKELDDLVPCPSFGEAIGELPAQRDSCFHDKNGVFMGTWECEPGKLKLDLDITEFCHIISGYWILTADDGVVVELKAGDSFSFPKGWKGISEVVETVRKVYTIIE